MCFEVFSNIVHGTDKKTPYLFLNFNEFATNKVDKNVILSTHFLIIEQLKHEKTGAGWDKLGQGETYTGAGWNMVGQGETNCS